MNHTKGLAAMAKRRQIIFYYYFILFLTCDSLGSNHEREHIILQHALLICHVWSTQVPQCRYTVFLCFNPWDAGHFALSRPSIYFNIRTSKMHSKLIFTMQITIVMHCQCRSHDIQFSMAPGHMRAPRNSSDMGIWGCKYET